MTLPPPAGVKINFERDIEPIFESSCLRCHGGEKVRSGFHLNRRAWALQGGDISTTDIVPGHANQSDLIYYVAGESKHIHMPPPGEGKPLTRHQISLLIAWIDQGAVWPSTNAPPLVRLSFAPAFGWMGVQGDRSKFRALEGVNDGLSGGVNRFSFFQQTSPAEKLSLSGHVIEPDRDIKLKLAVDETQLGFVHAGFDEWRQYFENNGGYIPNPLAGPPELNLNQNLHVDHGRFWLNFGLAPPNWPQIVLGYEYDFDKGTESTLDWGNANGLYNIAPSTQIVNEQAQILKLAVKKDFDDWRLEDNARVEFYTENNQSQEAGTIFGGAPVTRNNYHHVYGMNTLTLEKQICDWWFLSGGGYYSRLDGSGFFSQADSPYPQTSGSINWNSGRITLRRQSEIFSLASLFEPLNCLTFSVGSQNGWTRDEGFGSTIPDFEYANLNSASGNYDQFQAMQDADLRFTKIPYTVLFASARGEEGAISELTQEGNAQLMNQTKAASRRYRLQAGFNTSPWTWFEWNVQYERRYSRTDYNHLLDVFDSVYGNTNFVAPFNGYPAFILNRQIQGNGFSTKLTLRPALWLTTALSYRISATDYSSKTDPFIVGIGNPPITLAPGGPITDGRDYEQTCGLSATLTPFPQFYFSGSFTYSHSRVVTAENGLATVVPYRGDTCTFIASAMYVLNLKTSLQATYRFSRASFGQNNTPSGVPPGLDFTRHDLMVSLTRRLTKNLSGMVRYQFAAYSEPSGGDLNNFTANGIFATLIYRWP